MEQKVKDQTLRTPGGRQEERLEYTTEDGIGISLDTGYLKVKPRIGLIGGIAFVMGSVIGSGIFISPRGALLHSGSVGMSLVIWTLCGIISLILALVYAALGTMVPKSGSDFTYILVGVGEIPAFLVNWVSTVVTVPGSRTVLSLVFADYLCSPIFGSCGAPDGVRKTIAAVEILTLAITNLISVRLAATVQIVFTSTKVVSLIVISLGGFWYLSQGQVDTLQSGFEGTKFSASSFSLAVYTCMWAYGGYSNVNDMAEELKNPKRNIPLALIISLCLITVIYLTTNISYFALLSKDEFLSSTAVGFQWATKVLGPASLVLPVCVMLSVYGASNGGFFTDGRVRFAAARAGHLPEIVCFLHHKTLIPVFAIILNTVLSLIFLIPGDIEMLINMLGFVGTAVNGLSIIAYIRLRFTMELDKTTFRVPLVIPILGLSFCVFMLIAPFLTSPRTEFLYGVAFIASGLIVYFPFVYFKLKVPGLDSVTTFLQLLLQLCPTVIDKED